MRRWIACVSLLCLSLTQEGQAAEQTNYYYDALGRLQVSHKIGGPAAGNHAVFQYDSADNRSAVSNYIILHAAHRITSANGQYFVILQAAGNLVLYQNPSSPVALWSNGTVYPAISHATLQVDGNLVMYNTSNVALWSTNTGGNPGARLRVSNGGRLLICLGTVQKWSSGTGSGACSDPDVA